MAQQQVEAWGGPSAPTIAKQLGSVPRKRPTAASRPLPGPSQSAVVRPSCPPKQPKSSLANKDAPPLYPRITQNKSASDSSEQELGESIYQQTNQCVKPIDESYCVNEIAQSVGYLLADQMTHAHSQENGQPMERIYEVYNASTPTEWEGERARVVAALATPYSPPTPLRDEQNEPEADSSGQNKVSSDVSSENGASGDHDIIKPKRKRVSPRTKKPVNKPLETKSERADVNCATSSGISPKVPVVDPGEVAVPLKKSKKANKTQPSKVVVPQEEHEFTRQLSLYSSTAPQISNKRMFAGLLIHNLQSQLLNACFSAWNE